MMYLSHTKVYRIYSNYVHGIIPSIHYYLNTRLFDKYYFPVSYKRFIEYHNRYCKQELDKLHYTTDIFDCDDYARYYHAYMVLNLKSNAVFTVIGKVCLHKTCSLHAWNSVLVDDSEQPIFIEPQTGEILQICDKYLESIDGFRYYPWFIMG